MLSKVFADSPEYIARRAKPFCPTKVTIAELHAAVPKHLFEKNTLKGLLYVARDVICAVIIYKLGWLIEPAAHRLVVHHGLPQAIGAILKSLAWALYWFCQSVALAGWWCMAHEAGHGNISPHKWVNHLVGFSLHTFVLAPYFAWRATHHAHHKATTSIERDENYVPRTRKDLGVPPEANARDYHEIFEETPIYTLGRMLVMQLLGWQIYLVTDVSGSPRHPPGTNHLLPSSALFKPKDRAGIIASNFGVSFMACVLYLWSRQVGTSMFIKMYFIPYLLLNHWIVMLTYLHHSDPTVPMYREKQWSFVRGAVSTVDRPLLGHLGRFFFHNVSHDHISHHLFSSIPFYNQPTSTAAIKKVLKEDYNYDSTNSFRALWRTFTQCVFIEDEGDIVFYKNREGKAARELANDALERPTKGN
ncbi:delta-12 fatty acid desaturase [Marasmius fiardii PR-910]|nr:delta-12 fatty acid desaturase [Marasmius fiardii PR-910]